MSTRLLRQILKRLWLPCELWLCRSDARVRRALLRLCTPSGTSAVSRSAEKSESSVPSELLPAALYIWQSETKMSSHADKYHMIMINSYMCCFVSLILPVDNSTKIPYWEVGGIITPRCISSGSPALHSPIKGLSVVSINTFTTDGAWTEPLMALAPMLIHHQACV